MASRFAAIDLGTNTILLLIVELDEDGNFRILADEAEIARLGEGVDRNRSIGPEGEQRAVEELKNYLQKCQSLAVDEIAAVGTSALRDARNAGDFITRLKRELNLDLRVLSGEEEARYSYLAVQRGLALGREEALVVDVGGGSTEFIWAKEGRLHRWASLDLGSVRLTERFLLSDPVKEKECARLAEAIDHELGKSLADWKQFSFHILVGIAGTFTTLAAVAQGLKKYSHSEVHGKKLDRAEVARQIRLYRSKTIAQRREIPGLEPKRADVILAGALLIERILEHFHLEQAIVSDQGIRYGLLYEKTALSAKQKKTINVKS